MSRSLRLLLASVFALALAAPVQAQRMSRLELPRTLPSVADEAAHVAPGQAVSDLRHLDETPAGTVLDSLRDRVRESQRLLRRYPEQLDRDPAGDLVLKQQLLALAPTPEALARIAGAGFVTVANRHLDELGLDITVLHAPDGLSTREALALLRRLDPAGSYEFDHVYLRSGAGIAATVSAATPAPTGLLRNLRVGLVDGGVDAAHPALAKVDTHAWGCNGKRMPDAHGTEVASLLMGGATAQADGGTLYAADIWCGQAVGGGASELVEALAWMAREKVPVINLSLVGPDNAVLRRATEALIERGHVLVAAVGNDGPSAPPLYPAAYPGVIGVSAVDGRGRVLPEAGRGAQVAFAALGSGLRAACPDGRWTTVRGTSFAAPLVAHRAALQIDALRAGNPGAVLQALARDVHGNNGARNDATGLGVLEN